MNLALRSCRGRDRRGLKLKIKSGEQKWHLDDLNEEGGESRLDAVRFTVARLASSFQQRHQQGYPKDEESRRCQVPDLVRHFFKILAPRTSTRAKC